MSCSRKVGNMVDVKIVPRSRVIQRLVVRAVLLGACSKEVPTSTTMRLMRRRVHVQRLAAFAFLTLGANSLEAQASERLDILKVAIAHAAPGLPPGQIVLDPRAKASGQARKSVETSELALILRGPVDLLEARWKCDSDRPDSCRIEGAAAIVAVDDPQVNGNSASVSVRTWVADERVASRPVTSRKVILTLVRSRNSWRVVREATDRIS